MLRELRIENFALVDKLAASFGEGLVVITGETGAGKTVLFEAIALLLGGKSDRPVVRDGADQAILQGLFDLSQIDHFPLPDLLDEEGGLLLERRIPRSGRGRIEANGRLVTLEKLRTVARVLVDFHGQQEREHLLDRALQRAYLDAYADAGESVDRYAEAREGHRRARDARREAEERLAEAREREEFLRWQAREIDEASLQPGEEENLESEARLLREAEKLRELVYLVRDSLREGEGSAVDRVGAAADRLGRFADHGDAPAAAAEACRRALVEIEEALAAVDRLAARIDAPPGALEAAMERLETIAALKRKHRRTVEEILAYRESMDEELRLLDGGEDKLDRLGREESARAEELAARAAALSETRRKKAVELGKAIEKRLRPLALAGARFSIRVDPVEEEGGDVVLDGKSYRAGREGIDRIEFLFAANKGEPPLPLRQVASGGEVSRVMLAVKRSLTAVTRTPTAVFDEIDAGVGGDVGERVGATLAEVARGRQILCITHLPAIASLGAHHLHVRKLVRSGRTVIAVEPLEGEARVDELVRMMGGGSRRKVSVPHAEEILRAARRKGGR